MGDRGNLAVLQEGGKDQVWLYTHWCGASLPGLLQDGLTAGRARWEDEPYLTKMLFGFIVEPSEWQQETGFGVSCRLQDHEWPVLVVDIANQRVFTIEVGDLESFKVPLNYNPKPSESWTFEEYVELKNLPW